MTRFHTPDELNDLVEADGGDDVICVASSLWLDLIRTSLRISTIQAHWCHSGPWSPKK